MKSTNFIIFILIFVLVFVFTMAASASAGLLRIESKTFMSNRLGDDLKNETPLFEEFQTNYIDSTQKIRFDFDFGYTYDFSKKVYNLDLNQLHFEKEIAPHFQLSVGRNFDTNHIIKSSIVDSVALDYSSENHQLKTGTLFGLIRNYEFDKYLGSAPIYSWYLTYRTDDNHPWTFALTLDDVNYSQFNRLHYQSAKTSIKKEFTNTDIFASLQNSLSFKNSYRREIGINYYPHYDWTMGFTFSQFEKNKNEGVEKSIFNSFSVGQIQSITTHLGHTFNPDLYWGMSFEIDQYPIQLDQYKNGGKLSSNLNYSLFHTVTNSEIFLLKSYGGEAFGFNLRGNYKYSDYLSLILEDEWVTYQKITSEKNQAFTVRAGLGTQLFGNVKLEILGDRSSNNFYAEDWSLLMRLKIIDWREI